MGQLFVFALIAMLLAATGCGGKSGAATGPPAETDTLTITAASGSIVQSATWTVSILP
jgi:apolipoprotein N-acyltransferase